VREKVVSSQHLDLTKEDLFLFLDEFVHLFCLDWVEEKTWSREDSLDDLVEGFELSHHLANEFCHDLFHEHS
jgi:hypothetical protein